MHPLYDDAIEVTENLREARLRVVDLSAELAQVQYDLAVIKARVERELIKKVGSEKRLGPTIDARERVYVRARNADEEYRAALERQRELEVERDRAKVEVRALGEKLALMQAVIGATGAADG